MRRSRTERALAALAVAALALACRAFDRTIPERAGREGPAPEDVALSLEEDHPDLLGGPPAALIPAPRETAPEVAYVPPRIGGDELVQIEFRDANLSQVVHFLAERAGVNVFLDPYVDRRVDVSFPAITLDAALQVVLARCGMRLVEEPQGVFWIDVHDGSQPAAASFTVQSIKASDVEANLRTLVTPATRVVVDASQNLIVVRGTQSDVDVVRAYLDEADRLKRQVLIEVRILEVTLNERFQMGIEGQSTTAWGTGLLTAMQDLSTVDDSFTFQVTGSDGDPDATVNLIQRLAGTDLVSSPRVLALSGSEAKIEVITEIPYVEATTTTTGSNTGTGTSTVQEVEFKEAGIRLTVTPTIQEGGTVHVHVQQELSEVVDRFNEIPILDKRTLNTDFLVGDRSTVVLGGLMQDKAAEVDKGVPGLMHLPLVGRLFRSDDDESGKRELLIFLTPRIVDPHEAARMTHVFRGVYAQRVRATGVRSHAAPARPR
jgi:type II secretory pathway component GspD/PulD (secretin)